ncbi:MAG: hypothetical protein JXB88_16345 [Spirochaetales bacterium]|nr:hypothetical protein [Spirochaetales bacterium]
MKRLYPLYMCAGIMVISILYGCVMTIAQIREDPRKYSGKKVTLSGKIDIAIPIPFTKLYVYTLTDSTGTAVIFSDDKHSAGDSMQISGTVITFPEDEVKDESKKSVTWLKEFLIENDLVKKEIAQGVAEVIINTFKGIAGGLGKIFFIKEQ